MKIFSDPKKEFMLDTILFMGVALYIFYLTYLNFSTPSLVISIISTITGYFIGRNSELYFSLKKQPK